MTNDSKRRMTRREFIRDATVATVGGSLLLGSQAPVFAELSEDATVTRSEVVLIRDLGVLDGEGEARHEVVREMLDAAVSRLTGEDDARNGWRRLIRPDDVVGIKTNAWTPIGTTAAVEQSLRTRVLEAGVSEENVGIGDRDILGDPVFDRATALINARPMRTHHWSGVGSLIKNYIMFVDDPYNYHEDACARLGEIWTYPAVAGKTRLNVLVMFTPQFHTAGAHGFSPRHVKKYHGLIAGFDPVAVDTVGVQIIRGMRREHFDEDRPMSPSPGHITVAGEKYGLGNADPQQIDLIKLGYDENSYC